MMAKIDDDEIIAVSVMVSEDVIVVEIVGLREGTKSERAVAEIRNEDVVVLLESEDTMTIAEIITETKIVVETITTTGSYRLESAFDKYLLT